jgi:hypothetical protein
MFVVLFGFIITLTSIAIPMYGYIRKRWKGVAIGCLLQPVACVIAMILIFSCIVGFDLLRLHYQYKSAMVTIKTTEPGTYGVDTLTWYLKADDECLVEIKKLEKPDSLDADNKNYDKDHERFDIIRLDSLNNAVCIEDRLVIRFDLQNQKITATDYEQPAEIVEVDWDKVKTYFAK